MQLEKIFAEHIIDQGDVSRRHKECLQVIREELILRIYKEQLQVNIGYKYTGSVRNGH
jgi:hypothetical protein